MGCIGFDEASERIGKMVKGPCLWNFTNGSHLDVAKIIDYVKRKVGGSTRFQVKKGRGLDGINRRPY